MTHWAEAYVGDPWVAGEHDCFAFARRVWRERFALEVPVVDVDATSRLASMRAFSGHPEVGNWQQVETPQEGDGVLIGKNKRPGHVGVWIDIDGGRILHCVVGAGVVCQDPKTMRMMGWNILGFYRRRAG